MVKDVLVGMDGSNQAERALEFAIRENPSADLTVVYAYGIEQVAGRGAVIFMDDEALDAAEQGAEAVFERAREMAADLGHEGEMTTVAEQGDPEAVITENAADADEIYIGSHARDDPVNVLLGDTAEKVVRRSPVPVTVVK